MEGSYYSIKFSGEPKLTQSHDIDRYLIQINELKDFWTDIRDRINEVVDEFDCRYELDIQEWGESNAWVDTIKKVITINFYI
jgi:hypothetical protein